MIERGDIYEVVLDPTIGHETKGRRRVLVLTPSPFNDTGLSIVVPVLTVGNLERDRGFAIYLIGEGATTTGVAICNQPRSLDIRARNGRFVETLSEEVVNEVIQKVVAMLD